MVTVHPCLNFLRSTTITITPNCLTFIVWQRYSLCKVASVQPFVANLGELLVPVAFATTVFAVKPTSSILTSRKTIDKFGKNTTISVKGRHDPCVGIRAVPVGEAMMNCVLLDHYLMNKAQCS